MVGYYMDTYFPDRDIRFIAVNDNIDSDEGESEIAPFKNVLNEFYARDISKKCRSSYRISGSTGEPLAPPRYGYIKSPDNPKKWIIDPGAAQVVRNIFKMALEGKNNETIARILQERKVLIPTAYWQEKGIRKGGKVTQPNKYKWCKTTVTKILTQQEYCGDIINFKTYSKSYKNKKRYDNPKENWMIFKDVHEPIISRDDFELVQTLVVKTKRRAPKKENGEKNMFCDFLYCADCSSIKKRKAELKHAVEIIDDVVEEGKISDANLRMLIEKVVIYEVSEGLNIEVELNANFRNHKNYYDEKGNIVFDTDIETKSYIYNSFIERSRGRKTEIGIRP